MHTFYDSFNYYFFFLMLLNSTYHAQKHSHKNNLMTLELFWRFCTLTSLLSIKIQEERSDFQNLSRYTIKIKIFLCVLTKQWTSSKWIRLPYQIVFFLNNDDWRTKRKWIIFVCKIKKKMYDLNVYLIFNHFFFLA